MKNNWQKVKLREIVKQFSSGITPSRTNLNLWKNEKYFWLKTDQLGEKYIYETKEKISQKALDDTSIKLFPKNTLSIAMYGEGKTRGNVSILKNEMAANQACCNIITDEKKQILNLFITFLKLNIYN
jgi:type I restriction enzyme S subunit